MAKKVVKKAARRRPRILPKKMSALIKIALADMRKAEAKPKQFIINMDDWLYPKVEVSCEYDGIIVEKHIMCAMCAAGSVMAFTLGALKKRGGHFSPHNFTGNADQLQAIDALRTGSVTDAAQHLELFEDEGKYSALDCEISDYDRDSPKRFHKEMTDLQKRLEKAGL